MYFFSQAGLTTLFNSLLLYRVNYHSLAVHLRPICQVDWTINHYFYTGKIEFFDCQNVYWQYPIDKPVNHLLMEVYSKAYLRWIVTLDFVQLYLKLQQKVIFNWEHLPPVAAKFSFFSFITVTLELWNIALVIG